MITKICSLCKRELDESLFHFKDKSKGLRNARCIDCDKQFKHLAYLKYYYKNKKDYRDRENKRRLVIREFIDSILESGCSICGEHDKACLDFHHLDPNEKEFQIAEGYNYSLDKVKLEISKCIVLCSNCHRKLHFYNLSVESMIKEK